MLVASRFGVRQRIEGSARSNVVQSIEGKGDKEHGRKTDTRTSTTSPPGLRLTPGSPPTSGTGLVRQKLHREFPRRRHAHRGARNRSWSVHGNGDRLLGAGLCVAQLWPPA